MRYAIFSDVHANERAWDQVLSDIRGQNADVLVCLGDVVGYGPKPEEVLRKIRTVTDNFVMGNHDAAAAGVMDYSVFNDQARHSIEWTMQALSTESKEFLSSVPLAIEADEILFVHAEISEPGRFAYIDSMESARENFTSSSHFVTFVGHTHEPNIFRLGEDGSLSEFPDNDQQLDPSGRYIVNVGSVGEPRIPDDLRGVYVIYDSETREVAYRKVAFDIEAYRSDLESTSLGLKPYFLRCYENQLAENKTTILGAAHALAMEAPAVSTALLSNQSGPVSLHLPNEPLSFRESRQDDNPKKGKGRMLLLLALAGLLMISLTVLAMILTKEDVEPEAVLIGSDNTTIIPTEISNPGNGNENLVTQKEPDTLNRDPSSKANNEREMANISPPSNLDTAPDPLITAQPEPTPDPEPAPDPVVAWWRMEEDSVGVELVDFAQNHSLLAEAAGSRIGGIAPPIIPGNGAENHSALGLGVWSETNPRDIFELRKDRSFTFEGWVLTDKPRTPIFLAGTRSGDLNDGHGWHIDIRPPTDEYPNGQMCFFYDNGPEIIQALSEDTLISDLKPHHFAAVWDHSSSKEAGEMRLFLDGKQIASTQVSHSKIPDEQANNFRIGSPANPPRVGLDEVRFSKAALNPRLFLNITPEIILLEENFEVPDVTGLSSKSLPAGWVGSTTGYGSNRRGIIDKGNGAKFTTPDGDQAIMLNYANAGITSKKEAIEEVLTAGRTYRITFNVGTMKEKKTDYLVELVAFEPKHDDKARADTTNRGRPGFVLAKATGNSNSHDLADTHSIVFKPESTNPHLGKKIGIRLARLGHNGIPIFDKIKLTSRAAEPIASPENTTTLTISIPKEAQPVVVTTMTTTQEVVSKPNSDPTVSWWRMETDTVDSELTDSTGKHPLSQLEPGKTITPLAPEILPSNGVENNAAVSLGVWGQSEMSTDFAISARQSFTLEGWFLTARPRTPIFLAGTRSGDSNDKQGWHVDIRPRGLMCFFFDNGPDNNQALSEELPVGDLKPHHFAAVWDHDASIDAGEMRLYFDGDLAATTELLYSQIPETPANPFRIGSPTNPPKIGLDEVRFSRAALPPLEFLRAETQSMIKDGKWSDGANWSANEPPSGTQTAVMATGVTAQIEKAPPAFAGDLVLEKSAKLTIQKPEALAILPNLPSKLILHQGSELILTAGNRGKNPDMRRIELAGNATIWGGRSTQGHHSQRLFSEEISGRGALILDGVNNNKFCFGVANSFEGGLVAKSTQKQGFHVVAKAAGSLGKGNVEIAANASLIIETEDAFAPGAILTLSGTKDGRSPSKLVLNANNTVSSLYLDGAEQSSGTWGAPGSGADHEHAYFSGVGILSVAP